MRSGVILLVTALLGGVAHADAVRDAVEAGNRAFIAAFKKGDARAIADMYTEHGQVIAPGAPVAKGRAAIEAAWKQSIETGVKDVKLTTLDVESDGNLAYETGVVRLVGRDDAATEARYVVVWKRTDGRWKMHRDIWNAQQ